MAHRECLLRRLRALKCPTQDIAKKGVPGETFDPLDSSKSHQFMALVRWLEDRKIRHYGVESTQRRALRQSSGSVDAWKQAFVQYMVDIGCPQTLLLSADSPSATNKSTPKRRGNNKKNRRPLASPAAVLWLVGRAIACESEDKAATLDASNSSDTTATATPAADIPPPPPPAADAKWSSKNVKSLLIEIYTTLGAHPLPSGSSVLAQLQHLVETAVMNRSAQQAVSSVASPPTSVCSKNPKVVPKPAAIISSKSVSSAVDITQFRLGFSTGDGMVDRISVVLKMLYLADLRDLQDAINDIIVSAQRFTGDPKTDARLGKVGRIGR